MVLAYLIFSPFIAIGVIGIFLWIAGRRSIADQRSFRESLDPRLPAEMREGGDDSAWSYKFIPARRVKGGKVPAQLELSVNGNFNSCIFLSYERNADRILQDLGFSDESIHGNPSFDQMFHVILQDPSRSLPFLKKELVTSTLMAMGREPGFQYLEITSDRCRIRYSAFFLPDEMTFDDYVAKLRSNMGALAGWAQTELGNDQVSFAHHFDWRMRLYESRYHGFFFAAGFFSVVMAWIFEFDFHPLHRIESACILICVFTLIMATLLVSTRPFLRQLKLPSNIFLNSLFGVSLILFSVFSVAVYEINESHDYALSQIKTEPITDRSVYYHNNSRSYDFKFEPSIFKSYVPFLNPCTITINEETYAHLKIGRSSVSIDYHPGFLGIPWYSVNKIWY